MSYTIRKYVKEDYPTLCSWWKMYEDKGWMPVNEEFLPEDGYICEYDGKPISTAFIYTTNSKVAWIEWIIADRTADKEIRGMAVKTVMEHVVKEAEAKGSKYQFICAEHPSLMKLLTSLGFIVGDKNITLFIRRSI